MSMLVEKRVELVAKLDALEFARKVEINNKVEAYRNTLEAQTPRDEIEKVKNVISALDEVIAYENLSINNSNDVNVRAAEVVNAESKVEQSAESRPGMATVFAPSRD